METRIRPATEKDFKTIQELNHKLFINDHDKFDSTLDCEWPFRKVGMDYYKKRLSGNGFAAIAEIGRIAVGYLLGTVSELEPEDYRIRMKLAELENMYVLPKHQRSGLGSLLVQAFLKWCKEQGCTRIRVTASFGNKQGANFYKKMGFSEYDLVLEKDI